MDKKLSRMLLVFLLSALMPILFSCNDGGGGGGGGPQVQLDQTQCKNVGFGVQTQVHVEASPTATLEWKFVVGSGEIGEWPGGAFGKPAPTLTGADTADVSFTTFTIEETLENLNRPLRDRFEILPFSAQEVNYILEVTVNGKEPGAEITCTSAGQYGGWQNEYIPTNFDPETQTLPFRGNTHLGVPVYFNGGANGGTQTTWNWSVTSAPAGSTASIVDGSSRTPHSIPDVVGDYEITESMSGRSFNVSASEWTGAPTCQFCHSIEQTRSDDGRTLTPKFAAWQATGHASMFQRGIDGELSPFYNEGCIGCHTVGYNLGITADNGGFDDVQLLVGWEFPETLEPGNFEDGVPDELKAPSNIQCENCHGPGKRHAETGGNPQAIVVNYTANDCNQCHDEPPYHLRGVQWNNSPHSVFVTLKDLSSRPLGEDDPALRGSCTRCHTTSGYVLWTRGTASPVAPSADFAEPQTCTACHDPHDEADNPSQVREFGAITTLAGYTTPESVAKGAQCIKCHNSRRPITTPSTLTNQNDAHAALQGDIFLGENLWFEDLAPGGVYPDSPHPIVTENACVDCHMAATPAVGSPERNLVGEHTFLVIDEETDFQNIGRAPTDTNPGSGCLSSGCHAARAGSFESNLPHTYGDFDGNGQREGVQTEIEGLIGLLQDKIGEIAMNAGWDAGCTPQGKPHPIPLHGRVRLLKSCCTEEQAETDESCLTHPAGGIPNVNIYKASFNLLAIEEDKSEGVHNTAFAVTALRTSYQQIALVPPPGDDYPHGDVWDGTHPSVVTVDNVTRCTGCHFEGNPFGADFPAPFPLSNAPCSSCHK